VAHTDVVEAKREDWTTDPFQFIEKDGFFYGRGHRRRQSAGGGVDREFNPIQAQGFKPERDIIVALTADEEGGGPFNGVGMAFEESQGFT